MGATSSKQGRYVVNPDSSTSGPRNFDPNTPPKAKAYRVIRSPAAVPPKDTSQVATSIRYNTYPEGCSTHNEQYYPTSNSPESEHGRVNDEFYPPYVKGVTSPSAETLTCNAPLDGRQPIRTSNHSQDDQSDCLETRDYSMDNANGCHKDHDRDINQVPRPHIGHNGHQLYSKVNKMSKKDLNSDHKNNNIGHPDSHQMVSNSNSQRLYMSIADYPRKQRAVVDSVVQLQEDGKVVTHFLPYTASTPLHQGYDSTSLFIPYITSTPKKQYQVVLQTPPQPPTSPPPPLPPASRDSDQPDGGTHSQTPGSFTILDALFLVGSMVMYMADIVLDILVAVQYYHTGETIWSAMTMAFIIIPSITLQVFSLRWHLADTLEAAHKQEKRGNLKSQMKVTLCTILTWLITHILQLGAINRYWRTLKFGWRSRSGKTPVEDYNQMVCEFRDTTMLRLLEAFMESAPQLVLQLYIMTQLTNIHWLTAASALASLVSLSWSLEAYHKALREADPNENNVGWCSLMIRMVAHTFLITSRVISLALFAAYFQWWVFVAAGSHWLLMFLWLICQKTQFCSNACEEILFDAVIGVVHIFSFFNMKPNRTRYRALGYYTLVFIENTVMFALWYIMTGKETMYGLPALVLVWGGFFLGIVTLLMYYRCCHPNGPMPLCDCHCLDKDSPDGVEKPHPEAGWDEVDGHEASHHIYESTKVRSKRIEGNLFARSGRRYLHWEQSRPTNYPVKQDFALNTQPIYVGDLGVKPTEQHVFLETSLL